MNRIVTWVNIAVAAAAFTLSFQSLARLGEYAGYGTLAVLYPLVLDLATVASWLAWRADRQPRALRACLVFLAGSIGLNAVEHWLLATATHPSWVLITIVGAVPPATLGACLHLGVAEGTQPARTSDAESPTRGQGPTVGFLPEPGKSQHDADLGTTEVRSDDRGSTPVVADPVAELIKQGAGRRRIAAVAGISEHQARVLLAERRNGHGGAL